jgi:hypothetical protein
MSAPEYTAEDFKAWLQNNQRILQGYRPDEVARLAMACGFHVDQICGPVADGVMKIKRLLEFWENPFSEKWMRATEIQNGHDDQ